MPHTAFIAAAALEKLREFDRVASVLDMPASERLGILNVSFETYSMLKTGQSAAIKMIQPEMERRLSYALPLMRRLASTAERTRTPQIAVMAAA